MPCEPERSAGANDEREPSRSRPSSGGRAYGFFDLVGKPQILSLRKPAVDTLIG